MTKSEQDNFKRKHKQYCAEYYIKNRARLLEQRASYRKTVRSEIRKRNIAYRNKNLAKILIKNAKYRNNNKERLRAQKAKYLLDNREALRVKSAANRAANPGYSKLQSKKYRDKNVEKLRSYRIANIEKISRRNIAYKAANAEKLKAKRIAYYAAHPEKIRIAQNKRRAVKVKASIGDLSVILKWEKSWRSRIFAVCFWCFVKTKVSKCHSDHIVPLSRGGAHCIENLCISCAECNLRKHAKSIHAWNKQISEPVLL